MPTGNLLLSVLDMYDIHQDSIGDSTGRLDDKLLRSELRGRIEQCVVIGPVGCRLLCLSLAPAPVRRVPTSPTPPCAATTRPCATLIARRPTSTRRRPTARPRCTGRSTATTRRWSNLLIRAGANVKAANRDGVDAAVAGQRQRRRRRSIEALLKAGADANEQLPLGETPLMIAARTGNVEAMKVLLDRGADVNAKETLRGTTPLMWAADEGARRRRCSC